MGIGNFFKKVSGAVSNFAQKAFTGVKNFANKAAPVMMNIGRKVRGGIKYVGKAVKPVSKFVSRVLDFTEDLPGIVGDISGTAKKYLDKFNNWVEEKVPEGKLKDKMKEVSDDVGGYIDRGEKYGRNKAEKVAEYGRRGREYANKADEYRKFAAHIDE